MVDSFKREWGIAQSKNISDEIDIKLTQICGFAHAEHI